MPMTLEIQGLKEFQGNIIQAASDIPSKIKNGMVEAVNVVKNTAQDLAPYKTGTLRRSIYTDVQENGFKGIVGQDNDVANYGIYMEYGTRPHIIMAVNKKVLADRRQNIIFGKIVHHPGTAARPFMEPALQNNLDNIREIFSKAVGRIIQSMKT